MYKMGTTFVYVKHARFINSEVLLYIMLLICLYEQILKCFIALNKLLKVMYV